jgi:hypothetical protein
MRTLVHPRAILDIEERVSDRDPAAISAWMITCPNGAPHDLDLVENSWTPA